MLTLTGVPGVTVTNVCPVTPALWAKIVAVPTTAPVTNPAALTLATEGFPLDHVTPEAGDVFPDASVMVAEA